MDRLRLMAVLAHPDDESLGFGGTLAKYAAEGVETFLVTATRGERGRYRGPARDDPRHPGPEALATIREAELRAAASALGVHELSLLDYGDQHVDRADPRDVIAAIAGCIRRVRPDVMVTFGPEGAYGHPDHIAISQFATAAVVAAADPGFAVPDAAFPPHAVSKFYYMEWPRSTWAAYEEALRKLRAEVDGVERQAVPWPDWSITTVIDTRDAWPTVWRAVSCHDSQIAAYERLKSLTHEHHEAVWGRQSYYHFEEQGLNYVEHGPQNSRGFRALKVWLALRQAGAAGYRRMISDDIHLSRTMAEAVRRHPELELMTQNLSIATFRYVPAALRAALGRDTIERYLDTLNERLLDRIQRGGEAFVSNAVIGSRYVLRARIVNFHTGVADVEALPEIVARLGRTLDAELRPDELRDLVDGAEG